MKKKLITSFLLCLFLLGNITTSAFGTTLNLSVASYQQEKSLWCWDASCKDIIQFCKGSSLSQTDLCIMLFGNSNNQGATCTQSRSLLSQNNLYTDYIGSSLSYSALQDQINWYRPIFAALIGFSGHANVIRGYDTSTNRISYCEPNDGSWQYMNYSSYCDGIHNDGNYFYWAETIYNIHKSR